MRLGCLSPFLPSTTPTHSLPMGPGPGTRLVLVGLSEVWACRLVGLYIELSCPQPAWVRQYA